MKKYLPNNLSDKKPDAGKSGSIFDLFKRKYTLVLVLFIFALLLRIYYLYQYSGSPLFDHIVGPDVEEYNNWAESILQGNYIWKTVSIHSPIYSYYLAVIKFLTGNNYFYIRLLQLFIGMVGFTFLFNTIYEIKTENEKLKKIIAYIFLCSAFFFVPLFYYQGEIISESLLIPLICFTITCLYSAEKSKGLKRIINFFFAGIISGLAVITHPISIFFVFAEIAYLSLKYFHAVFYKKNYLPISLAFFGLPVFIIIISISVYNSILNDSPVFIQKNSGYNFYLGNNSNANGMCNISAGPEWVEIHRWADSEALGQGISKNEFFYREVFKYITEDPLGWLKLIGIKALLVWNYKDIYSSMDPLSVKYYTGIMQYSVYFMGIISVLALFGILSIIRFPGKLFELRHFFILIISVWFGLTFTVVSDRYRYLFLPGLFVFVPCGLISFYYSLKNVKQTLSSMLLFLFSVVIVYIPVYKIDTMKDRAFAFSMLGEAYYKTGDYNKAKKYLFETLHRFPDWDRCYNDLGIMELKTDPENSIKFFKKAHQLVPSNPTPVLNTALAYSALGKNKQAQKFYKTAFELDKTDADIIYNYAYSIYKTENFKEALNILSYAELNNCSSCMIRNLTGVIYLKMNEPEKALKYLQQNLFYAPGTVQYQLNLAICYLVLKRNRESGKIIEKILKKEPDNKIALRLKNRLKDF